MKLSVQFHILKRKNNTFIFILLLLYSINFLTTPRMSMMTFLLHLIAVSKSCWLYLPDRPRADPPFPITQPTFWLQLLSFLLEGCKKLLSICSLPLTFLLPLKKSHFSNYASKLFPSEWKPQFWQWPPTGSLLPRNAPLGLSGSGHYGLSVDSTLQPYQESFTEICPCGSLPYFLHVSHSLWGLCLPCQNCKPLQTSFLVLFSY